MYQLLWRIFHQPHPDFRGGRNAGPQNLSTADKKLFTSSGTERVRENIYGCDLILLKCNDGHTGSAFAEFAQAEIFYVF